MCPAVKPTAPEIVNIQRPERPAFFDDCRLNLHYEIPAEGDTGKCYWTSTMRITSMASHNFKKQGDREY